MTRKCPCPVTHRYLYLNGKGAVVPKGEHSFVASSPECRPVHRGGVSKRFTDQAENKALAWLAANTKGGGK